MGNWLEPGVIEVWDQSAQGSLFVPTVECNTNDLYGYAIHFLEETLCLNIFYHWIHCVISVSDSMHSVLSK